MFGKKIKFYPNFRKIQLLNTLNGKDLFNASILLSDSSYHVKLALLDNLRKLFTTPYGDVAFDLLCSFLNSKDSAVVYRAISVGKYLPYDKKERFCELICNTLRSESDLNRFLLYLESLEHYYFRFLTPVAIGYLEQSFGREIPTVFKDKIRLIISKFHSLL